MEYTANEVIPGLWQGSAPPDADLSNRWDVVVLAAAEWQPVLQVKTVLRAPFHDDQLSTKEAQIASRAAETVAELVRRGERVLVTCLAGLNRSGLIVALALRRLGHDHVQAVALVRKARGDEALTNSTFLQFIKRN